jgi:hypothetical protein
MFVVIFIVAVVISAFFDQQGRRHRLELEIEYEKLGKNMPPEPPKLPMLESAANVLVGLILIEIGAVSLCAFLYSLEHAWKVVAEVGIPGQADFLFALVAGGIALVILGTKSVVANLKFRKR